MGRADRNLLFILAIQIFVFSAYADEQVIQSGGKGYQHTGSGNIVINGYSIEQHERDLREQEQKIRKELARVYRDETRILSLEKQNLALEKQKLESEKRILEKQLSNVQAKVNDLQNSYKERIQFLESTIHELRVAVGPNNDAQLEKAVAALQRGDTELADRLFQQVEEMEQASIKRAAKSAFERGRIAAENLDYWNAYRHYERAVGLSPDDPQFLTYAGSMAGMLARHRKEIEWKERALQLALKQKGEESSEVATCRNNLGVAWKSLGEYKKAIGYYEQALKTLKHSLGVNHPNTKLAEQNLSKARDRYLELEQANP